MEVRRSIDDSHHMLCVIFSRPLAMAHSIRFGSTQRLPRHNSKMALSIVHVGWPNADLLGQHLLPTKENPRIRTG